MVTKTTDMKKSNSNQLTTSSSQEGGLLLCQKAAACLFHSAHKAYTVFQQHGGPCLTARCSICDF